MKDLKFDYLALLGSELLDVHDIFNDIHVENRVREQSDVHDNIGAIQKNTALDEASSSHIVDLHLTEEQLAETKSLFERKRDMQLIQCNVGNSMDPIAPKAEVTNEVLQIEPQRNQIKFLHTEQPTTSSTAKLQVVDLSLINSNIKNTDQVRQERRIGIKYKKITLSKTNSKKLKN